MASKKNVMCLSILLFFSVDGCGLTGLSFLRRFCRQDVKCVV